jgi:glycosyltransferase involved in cell wall biosynthesis
MDLGIREYFFKEFRGEVEIEYMPPVVDVDVFNPFINGRKARGKLKLHDDDLVILYLGSLAPYRRIDILVKAFSYIVKEHPNARLMIGGMGKKDHLVRLAKQLNLGKYVLFLSWMPYAQIPELIAASDICVDPYPRSGTEEFQLSLKILEYMAVGKCVIAAKNRGNMQLIQDGFNGMLLTPNSVEDLKCKITQLIIDKKLRQKLGKMAWITVKERYSGRESFKVLEEKLIK